MEYRAWIHIPGLPLADEHAWAPLMAHLEHEHGEYGPIIGWDNDAHIVLSTDAPSEAEAAQMLYHAVAESLRAQGLAHLYPAGVEIEPADDHLTAER